MGKLIKLNKGVKISMRKYEVRDCEFKGWSRKRESDLASLFLAIKFQNTLFPKFQFLFRDR